MKYDIILFDADETLFDFKKSEREAFKAAILDFKIPYDEVVHLNTYQKINTEIWKELELGQITQKELKVERFRRLAKQLEANFEAEVFAANYLKHLANGSFLYEESEELIQELSKTHKLFIVTNGLTDVQRKRIGESCIASYFEDLIISEEVGISKPNPEIFEHALKTIIDLDKTKILMVGDSLTSDIQGGIHFGIDTCWYNPEGIVNDRGILPTYEIKSLTELKRIV
jgi:putative hydrolase of the HAD superfamily